MTAMILMPLLSTLKLEASHDYYCEIPDLCACQRGAHPPMYLVLECDGQDAVAFTLEIISTQLKLIMPSRTFPKNASFGYILGKVSEGAVSGVTVGVYGERRQRVVRLNSCRRKVRVREDSP